MSKSTTKKATAPEPMDPTAREVATAAPVTNNPRACYAAKTLVAEVNALFPETPFEYSNYDGRNTALDVTFDMTALDSSNRADLIALLILLDDPAYNSDPRINEVLMDDGIALVSFKSNARTQDDRSPFGLADALLVLGEDREGSL